MASNFMMVKRMRYAINDGVSFQEFYKDFYKNKSLRKPKDEMMKLWTKACSVSEENKWKAYLGSILTMNIRDMVKTINELYEEGVSETTLSTLTGIDVKSIASFLK